MKPASANFTPGAEFVRAHCFDRFDAVSNAAVSDNGACDEEYTLAPLLGPSREEVAFRLSVPSVAASPASLAPTLKPYQWTLKELGIVSMFASVGLAGASWMPATVFAGLAGVLSFLAVYFGGNYLPDARKHRAIYIGFFTLYACAILSTCFQR